jgi:hypothetical protein
MAKWIEDLLIAGPPEECTSLRDWLSLSSRRHSPRKSPDINCFVQGCHSDRLAWVFAAGYRAAIEQVFGSPNQGRPWRSLVLREDKTSDRSSTSLSIANGIWSITGDKAWAVLLDGNTELLVLARQENGGAKRISRVLPESTGVTCISRNSKALPELPQVRAKFDNAKICADGLMSASDSAEAHVNFSRFERQYVLAALLGYIVKQCALIDPSVVRPDQLSAALGDGGKLESALLNRWIICHAQLKDKQKDNAHSDRWARDWPAIELMNKTSP